MLGLCIQSEDAFPVSFDIRSTSICRKKWIGPPAQKFLHHDQRQRFSSEQFGFDKKAVLFQMNQQKENHPTTPSIQKKNSFRLADVFLGIFLLATTCHAGLTSQTWVSSTGNDNSPTFSWSQPGRTFAAAIKKTAPGGTISCRDEAHYGPVRIDRSVTIRGGYYTSRGKIGRPLSSGSPAIVIDAGDSGIVTINSIVLEGSRLKSSAVEIISAKSVEITKCDILNLDRAGGMAVAAYTPKTCAITIDNCTFDRGACAIMGNNLSRFFVTNSLFSNYSFGAVVPGGGITTLENCVFRNNFVGVEAVGGTTSLRNCQIEGTGKTSGGIGLQVWSNPSAKIFISGNKFFSHSTGISCDGKTTLSSAGNAYWNNLRDRDPFSLPR